VDRRRRRPRRLPRSASHSVRPRCWHWSPRANQPADRPGAVHHLQDRQRARLEDPGQAGGRRVAARRPRSLTASGSTNNDPILICGLFLLAGPATSPLGEPFRASRGPRPLAGQPGRVAISRRSNALSDRCATKHGRPRSPPVPANVLVRQPERGPQRGAGPTDFVAGQRCIRAGRSLRRERAFLLVRGRMVGLGGVEPPTSSLSGIFAGCVLAGEQGTSSLWGQRD
jgi:hypothetical protein